MLNRFNVVGMIKLILDKQVIHNNILLYQIVISTQTPKGTYTEMVLTLFKQMYITILENEEQYNDCLIVFEGFIDRNKLIVTSCYNLKNELSENTLNKEE